MLKTTEKLIDSGWVNKIFTDTDVNCLFDGTPARRYGLINKALKKKEIIRLKRGVYLLALKYQTKPISQFYIASHMIPHSYISFESALSYHGWIPERVTLVANVIHQGRTKNFQTPLGEFTYTYIPTQEYCFLNEILRKEINGQPFLIAKPLRALCDLVYERKLAWYGLDFLTDSLRIEMENFETIQSEDFTNLMATYHSKKIIYFLIKLKESLEKYGYQFNSRKVT